MIHIDINALDSWAEKISQYPETQNEVKDLCQRFLTRYTCMVMENPTTSHHLMMRIYRSAIILNTKGAMFSTEFLRLRNYNFLRNADERLRSIQEASWDNKARPFNDRPSLEATGSRSLLDASVIPTLGLDAETQLRQFEIHIGIAILNNPIWKQVTVEKSPSVYHLLPDIRLSLKEKLFNILQTSRENAFEIFRDKLPKEILTTLSRCGVNDLTSWNWLTGAGIDISETMIRNRQQATKAYPLLFRALSAGKNLGLALENEEPLIPVIAHELKTTTPIIKKINGLCCHGASLLAPPKTINEFKPIWELVSYMGKSQNPKNAEEWKTYFALAKTATKLATFLNENQEFITQYLAGANLKQDCRKAQEAQDDIQDVITDLHVNIMLPWAKYLKQPQPRLHDTALAIVGKRSLDQILDVCSWWHENQAQIRLELSERFPTVTQKGIVPIWPCLHESGEPWTCTNGLQAVALTSERQLIEEHNRMRHCVNQYVDACRYSGRHIISFRALNVANSATAEFSQELLIPIAGKSKEPPDGKLNTLPPGCIQFKGVGNVNPSPQAWTALWEYVSGLMTGDIPMDIHGLRNYQAMNSPSRKNEAIGAYYNAESELALETAWRLYAPMLPRSARRLPAHRPLGEEVEVARQPRLG
jgi:hypothetical protein